MAVTAFIFIFNFLFFRDPNRDIPPGENLILSPADGKIIKIDEIYEPLYFKKKVKRISIFLSVFDVHINRIPVSGTVDFLQYNAGKFNFAFADSASETNEHAVIGIDSQKGKILFKQIAGIVARRIIYHIREGERVEKGKRFGMIRYGSRVDMFFPDNVTLKIQPNQRVLGGETIIGTFE